jgi:predicted nucleic acid-binding protein
MADFVIFDTDVLIDAGRGVQDAVTCLKQAEEQSDLATSVVTQMELIIGCRDKEELQFVEEFLSRFHIVQLSEQISHKAVDLLTQYRLSHGLLISDALIAATAVQMQLPLISKNQRDYRFIEGLDLFPYPEPFTT